MAKQLEYFRLCTPNYANGNHVYFTDPFKYKTLLETSFEHGNISIDNYRINANVVKVSGAMENASDITYFIEYEETNAKVTYWRCYRVLSYIEQSGMLIFSCEIDNWATYLYRAKISNIHVSRCNRDLGYGVYDPIKNVKSQKLDDSIYGVLYSNLHAPYIPPSYKQSGATLNIVFVAQAVVQSNVTGENVTATFVFTASCSSIYSLFSAETQANHSTIELAIRAVSGIYATETGSAWVDNKVSVLKAFLFDGVRNEKSGQYVHMKTKTPYDNAEEKTIVAYFCQMGKWRTDYVIKPSTSQDQGFIIVNNNYDLYIGTKDNGLRLEHSTQDMHINIIYEIDCDGLHVKVMQGTREKDISNAFKVSLMGSNYQLDVNESIAFWTKTIVTKLPTLIVGVAASIATENPIPAIGAGIAAVSGTSASLMSNNTMSNSITSESDGFITYDLTSEDEYTFISRPFFTTAYASMSNEEKNARYNGVNYDLFIDDLATIKDKALLGEGNLESSYIVADMMIDNLPIEPRDDIYNQFRNGVYLTFAL
jgi:hypothetical protein